MSDVKTFAAAIEAVRANPQLSYLNDDELATKAVQVISAAIRVGLLEVYYADGLIGLRQTEVADEALNEAIVSDAPWNHRTSTP